MFRIKLNNGEETLFLSAEELTDNIRRGAVPSDALIYHAKSDRWIPVTSHPAYRNAQASAVTPAPPPPPSTAPPSPAPSERPATTPLPAAAPSSQPPPVSRPTTPRLRPTGRMVSSPAPPSEARNGSRGPALVLGAIAIVVVAVLGYRMIRPLRPHPGSTPQDTSTAPVAPAPNGPPAAPAVASGPATSGVQLVKLYSAAFEAARSSLDTVLAQPRLARLFDAGRLASPDSLRATLRALTSAPGAVAGYRGRAAAIEKAFADSSLALAHAGWTAGDQTAWAARRVLLESPEQIRQADSVLAVLTAAFRILVDQRANYQLGDSAITFRNPEIAGQYRVLREWLEANAGAEHVSPTGPAVLMSLLRVIGTTRLPPLGIPPAPSLDSTPSRRDSAQ